MMRYFELLVEYNEARILKDFGDKLITKIFKFSPSQFDPERLIAFKNEILKMLVPYDPTPNKEYMHWIAGNFARDSIKRADDLGRVKEALTKYHKLKLKKKIPNELRDINKLNFDQLQDVVEGHYKEEDFVEKRTDQSFFNSKEATLVYNDDEIKVVIPNTKEASMFFGVNTRWCTAAKEHNQFNNYTTDGAFNDAGPLYIVLLKKTNQRFQFHWPTKQFMDERDDPINPGVLANRYPKLWDIFTPIAEKYHSTTLNKNTSEETQLRIVAHSGELIRGLYEPSEEVQLAAISGKYSSDVIQFIKNPTRKVIIKSISTNGTNIKYVKNPDEELLNIAVNQNPWAIEYVKNPTHEMQLSAVRRNGHVIRNIKDPDESIQLAAVKEDYKAFNYINNPSDEVTKIFTKEYNKAQEAERKEYYRKRSGW